MQIGIEKVSMTYKEGKKALRDVSFSMQSPNLIGLVGPNGAGKSTLMKLIVARLLQTSGTISVDGVDLQKAQKGLKRRLGYLPQDFGLYDELTVYQFLDYIAVLKGLSKDAKPYIDQAIMDTNLSEKRNARIRTLSGGQKQRVGIAQAFLGNPELIILDEPTVGLDPEERVKFRNLFSRYARNKIVILSTHIIDDVQSICNRLIVLNQGVMRYDGEPDALIKRAVGHVGVYESQDENEIKSMNQCRVISRLMTTGGVQYRIVSDNLPGAVKSVPPTLEDAYMYLMAGEEV